MSFTTTFQKMIEQDRVPHLMLFSGPKGSGKTEMALTCAQKLLHNKKSDLHHYHPEGKTGMHTLYVVKNLCREIYLASHDGGYKCFIVHDAERMLPSNANALLKTFEEPPKKSVIFLLTTKRSLILPTILSRCQSYHFCPKKQEEKSDPLVETLLEVLSHKKSLLELASIEESLTKEREKREKAEAKKIPKELPALQREHMLKEIEGNCSLAYRERTQELFTTILQFYHDVTLTHLGSSKNNLNFPTLADSYKVQVPIKIEKLEEKLQKARLAHDRGLKLHLCLESLLNI